jgi:SAM-dependent methyltransferase
MSRRLEDHYRALLSEHGDSHLAAQYSSRNSQFLRFASLARITDVSGLRVLDFGCGTAALGQYLLGVGQVPSLYYGVDIVTDFFAAARRNVPTGRFSHPDELGEERFDVAFVSGVFNNRRRGNRNFWKETVSSLFDRCDIGVAFNLMSTYVDYRDPALFYEEPEAAFRYVKKHVTPYVSLSHNYLLKSGSVPFEFTMFAYRDAVELKLP